MSALNSFSAPKLLRVTLILAPTNSNATFPGTNSNTLILENLRISADIETVPGTATHADVRIFGMKRGAMNALTAGFFHTLVGIAKNIIILEANSGAGWTQVFEGTITEAQPEYRSMPNVFFGIQAQVNYQFQITPVPPLSFPGSADAAGIAKQLADQMGLAFENDGVTAQLSNPYFPGTTFDQLKSLCIAARCNFVIAGNKLAIYPFNLSRKIPPRAVLTPQSGLDGYPVLEKYGVVVTALYDPAIVAGGQLEIAGSDVPNANGIWSPNQISHRLECSMPNGSWHTVAQCTPVLS